MQLLRPATLTFETDATEWRQLCRFGFGRVGVRTMPLGDPGRRLTLAAVAEVPLDCLPEVTADNRVEIPLDARRKGEKALEAVADLIAVAEHCRRHISSPHPCVAFYGQNRRERAWLDERVGMVLPARLPAINTASFKIPPRLFAKLADRRRGVALLAEALTHSHATGRFHELTRFFEAAFALPYGQLQKKLAQFLMGGAFGYTRAEVRRWLHEVRDLAAHADRRPEVAMEADTRSVVDRMEQAAYDVLLNKKNWHSRDRQRRRAWQPDAAMLSNKGDAVVRTQGKAGPFLAQIFDAFGSYPLNLGQARPVLSEGAWIGDAETAKGIASELCLLKIVKAPAKRGRPGATPSPGEQPAPPG